MGGLDYLVRCLPSRPNHLRNIYMFIAGNLSEIIVICTESGIWQPISFQCVFDPTAVNLKDGASFGKFLPLRCQTSLLDKAFSLGALSKRDKHKLKK